LIDYSSVIIDYLLTDKPIILTPTDLEAYAKTRGLTMEPYEAWMPGEIALTYEELMKALDNALFGKDEYRRERERIKRITHQYIDGKSAERVLELARELMGIGNSEGVYNEATS
jgi:CDP-glycerol glycerophosphotransferase (TagB/SpsB family)